MNRGTVAFVIALTVTASIFPLVLVLSTSVPTDFAAFSSYSELFGYLDRTFGRVAPSYGMNRDAGGSMFAGPAAPTGPAGGDFSGTNVQVAGIDELDTAKTDGSYLYLAGTHDVAIVRAVPASNLSVIARLPSVSFENATVNASVAWVTGLFVVGSRLVIVSTGGPRAYPTYCPIGIYQPGSLPSTGPLPAIICANMFVQETYLSIYNLTDPAHPSLESNMTVSGEPLSGRLIAPFVYLVISEPVIRANGTYVIPSACKESGCSALPPQSIYYDPTALETSSFTNVLALDVGTGAENIMSIVTGYTSTVYMSIHSLYLTYSKWTAPPVEASPLVPVGNGIVQPVTTMWTTIHEVAVNGTDLQAVAHADVPGTLLDQYSMDEKAGYLRVFTTTESWTNGSFDLRNNLYVLDGQLARAGSLEGIAQGERIHAARFLGDRAYLVTFRSIDPLFAIDLSVPTAPRILGELNISGYSDYLYPIDQDHLLGIGQDAANTTAGGFNEPLGLKIALFDVSDAAHPVVLSQMIIGDPGTTSDVLWDAKAFQSIPSRGLVALPVELALINASQYPLPEPIGAWGQVVWQGAYLLSVNLTSGLSVYGRITHENGTADPSAGAYLNYSLEIHRSFYIGDNLYTISPAVVKVNALGDLSEVASVVYEPS